MTRCTLPKRPASADTVQEAPPLVGVVFRRICRDYAASIGKQVLEGDILSDFVVPRRRKTLRKKK